METSYTQKKKKTKNKKTQDPNSMSYFLNMLKDKTSNGNEVKKQNSGGNIKLQADHEPQPQNSNAEEMFYLSKKSSVGNINTNIGICINPSRGYNAFDSENNQYINQDHDASIKYSALKDRALLIDDLLIISHNNSLILYNASNIHKLSFMTEYHSNRLRCDLFGMSLINKNRKANKYSIVVFGRCRGEDGNFEYCQFVPFDIDVTFSKEGTLNSAGITPIKCLKFFIQGDTEAFGRDSLKNNHIIYSDESLKRKQHDRVIIIIIENLIFILNLNKMTLTKSKQVCAISYIYFCLVVVRLFQHFFAI